MVMRGIGTGGVTGLRPVGTLPVQLAEVLFFLKNDTRERPPLAIVSS
jgi:hypothetical protein